MRVTKLIFICLGLFLIGTTVNAKDSDPAKKTIREEIRSLIQKHELNNVGTESVMINFIINSDNEIIVVSTNNEDLEPMLRSILTLQKVDAADVKRNTIYSLPIQFRKM